MNEIVEYAKGFLLSPVETFKKTKGMPLSAAYQYYVVLLIIFTVLFGIVFLVAGSVAFNAVVTQMMYTPLIGNALSSGIAKFGGFIFASEVLMVYLVFLAMLVGVFISGLLLHVFVLLMGGEKGVEQTLKTKMFALTPALLLGWIPYVSIIGVIWSIVLAVIGLKENQEMTSEKAAGAVIIPLVLALIFAIIGLVVISSFLGAIHSILPG